MRINLLPERLKTKNKLALPVSADLNVLIRGFVFFWAACAIFLVFMINKVNTVKKSLSNIDVAWNSAEPLIKERDTLVKRKQELNSFLSLLEKDFKRDIVWSSKLTALSNLVPKEIWLKEMSFGEKEKNQLALDILAAASYLKTDDELLDKIDNFLEKLKKDPVFFANFQKLSLLEINKTSGEKGNIMDFKLRIFFKNDIAGIK